MESSCFPEAFFILWGPGAEETESAVEQGLYGEVREWGYKTWPVGQRIEKGTNGGEDQKGTNQLG